MKYNRNHIRVKTFAMFAVSIVMIIFAVGCGIWYGFMTAFNDHESTFTVTDKERVNDSSSSYYIVFGEDKAGNVVVYKNTDEFLRGKWDSSTMQAELEIGETYDVVLVGYRIPFLSMYENILEIERVNKNE